MIAEILWFLNKSLYPVNDYITLEQVLRLSVTQIDSEDAISPCISLLRSGQGCSHMVGHYLPSRIWKAMNSQIRSDALFVFSNKKRGPLLSGDIDRIFKKAGRDAGIKDPVSSLSLRPTSNSNVVINNSLSQSEDTKIDRLKEISVQEWDALCHRTPALQIKSGRPPKHDRRNLFNAILYHLRTKTPMRKLPLEYPPWKAVHSQYRRWEENGVFDAVLAARQ